MAVGLARRDPSAPEADTPSRARCACAWQLVEASVEGRVLLTLGPWAQC